MEFLHQKCKVQKLYLYIKVNFSAKIQLTFLWKKQAHFVRNVVKWDFLSYFQTLWWCYDEDATTIYPHYRFLTDIICLEHNSRYSAKICAIKKTRQNLDHEKELLSSFSLNFGDQLYLSSWPDEKNMYDRSQEESLWKIGNKFS